MNFKDFKIEDLLIKKEELVEKQKSLIEKAQVLAKELKNNIEIITNINKEINVKSKEITSMADLINTD